MNKREIYKREECEIFPNSFGMKFEEKEIGTEFVISFANMDIEGNRIDVLSEINITKKGFVSIFRRMLEVMAEYKGKKNIDLLDEIFDGMDGENDER